VDNLSKRLIRWHNLVCLGIAAPASAGFERLARNQEIAMLKLKPTGVSANGKRHYEIGGLPGAPKEIPSIRKRQLPVPMMSGYGPDLIAPRPPVVGEAITVTTDAGSIRIRVGKVRDDGAMIGTVEILNTPRGTAMDIQGIKHGDPVIVRGMDFVTLVHTDRART